METPARGLIGSIYSPPWAAAPWRLEDMTQGLSLRYFSFGRRALAAGLKAAGIGQGQAVLMPEFICRDLLSSLAAVGAKPVFYPVDAKLRPAHEPEDWPSASAVIAVNYFGFPQDLSPFRKYCAKAQAVLIEDNAHGLFSKDASGALLGTRGDLGVFSLRKTLPLANGAALTAARTRPLDAQEPFDGAAGPKFRAKTFFRKFSNILGPRIAFSTLSSIRSLRRFVTGHSLPPSDPLSERELPLPASPCSELSRPLLYADPKQESERRRSLYELLSRRLDFEPVFESLPPGTVPYAFPFRLPEASESDAAASLAGLGLASLPWPDLPSALKAPPKHYQDVRLVHFLW